MSRPAKTKKEDVLKYISDSHGQNGKVPTTRELLAKFGGSATTLNAVLREYETTRKCDEFAFTGIRPGTLAASLEQAILPIINPLIEGYLAQANEQKRLETDKLNGALKTAFNEHEADLKRIEELQLQVSRKEEELANTAGLMVSKITAIMEQNNADKEALRKEKMEMQVRYEVRLAEYEQTIKECRRQNAQFQNQIERFQKILEGDSAFKIKVSNFIESQQAAD